MSVTSAAVVELHNIVQQLRELPPTRRDVSDTLEGIARRVSAVALLLGIEAAPSQAAAGFVPVPTLRGALGLRPKREFLMTPDGQYLIAVDDIVVVRDHDDSASVFVTYRHGPVAELYFIDRIAKDQFVKQLHAACRG
jgi:hypothetical protein